MSLSSAQQSPLPRVVTRTEWTAARQQLLLVEKTMTQQLDSIAAMRRRLPMVAVEKDYQFEGPDGSRSLLELFDGRSQLILYHFMFAPSVCGWPESGCVGCSLYVDGIGDVSHLRARNTNLVLVSLAPLQRIMSYQKRMGWELPWYSSSQSDFNADFGLSTAEGEGSGTSVFLNDGKNIFQTYFTTGRGDELMGSVWSYLDITPFGRQETWEDSPEDWPQTPPYEWWRRHDEYSARTSGPAGGNQY